MRKWNNVQDLDKFDSKPIYLFDTWLTRMGWSIEYKGSFFLQTENHYTEVDVVAWIDNSFPAYDKLKCFKFYVDNKVYFAFNLNDSHLESKSLNRWFNETLVEITKYLETGEIDCLKLEE